MTNIERDISLTLNMTKVAQYNIRIDKHNTTKTKTKAKQRQNIPKTLHSINIAKSKKQSQQNLKSTNKANHNKTTDTTQKRNYK